MYALQLIIININKQHHYQNICRSWVTATMSDEQQLDESVFSFGTINQTQILKVYDGLPYNPFTFDLSLSIIKSIPPYQNNLSFQIASGCKSVFGRKKVQVQHVLKAPTISSRHFMIDEDKKIIDLGSTKGTFLWVSRDTPAELEVGHIYLIGTIQFLVHKMSYNQRKIWFKAKQSIIEISRKNNPFLIGSHKNCHYQINCPQQYLAYFNVLSMKLHNFLQDQDCDCQKGVWQRLSPPKQQSQPRQLQAQDLIMAFPYIFKAEY